MEAREAAEFKTSWKLRHCIGKLALVLLPGWAALGLMPGTVMAQEDETFGIEEVIVTAQRREQNLQDVPIAISAFTADTIEKNMFADVSEYLTQTPNASFITNGARSRRQISIRGISSFAGGGTTGFYVDDFSVAESTINPPIMDIERIEILRGPQATYFGRNALGGGINITSKKPTNDFHGSVMLDYSRFDTYDLEGVVNVPLIDDSLAMRFNVKSITSDGNIENINSIGGGNDQDYEYVKSSLRWTPSENLTVDVVFQYATEDVGMRDGVPSGVFSPFGLLLFGVGHGFPDRTGDGVADPIIDGVGFFPQNRTRTNFNFPQSVGTNFRNGVIRVDYERNDLLFTSITGYINSDFFLNGDIDGGSGDWFNEFRNIEDESISTEFRIQNIDDSRIQWNVGLFYAEDDGTTFNRTFVGSVPVFGLPAGFNIDAEDATSSGDTLAVFGQVDYDVNDKLTLSAGGRYSDETVGFDTIGFSGVLETILSVEDSYTDFSPRFALTYDASDTVTYYATASKGFKSGGVQIAPIKEKETFEPEELWNYEVGLKADLLDNRLRLSAALFYMDWTDLQVSFQENLTDDDGNFILFGGVDNADSATSKGAELSATALLSDDFLVNVNIGYLDAKFDKFVALIDGQNRTLDGETVPNSPEWTMSADGEYGFNYNENWSGYARLEWKYRDEINSNTRALIFSGYPWDVPSYNFFNLRIGAEKDNLQVVAYAENLFDKKFYTNAYQKAFAGGMFIEPSFRTYGLRLTYKFDKMNPLPCSTGSASARSRLVPLSPFARWAAALCCVLLCASAQGAAKTALVGGNVVNLDGGAPLRDAVVLVEGKRIVAIGGADEVSVEDDAEVVDVSGTWLIPGMMNMHVHLGLVLPGKMAAELANETEGELTLRMAQSARETLQAGVTTIRLPGEQRHGDISLKKAIARGQAHGPRIFSAGEALVITGGHGSERGVVYNDGPHELIKAARKEISAGASWVKILISGGIATEGGDISEALMTPEEISAVVDAAHRFGARVAAHSGSPVATDVAIDAGIDSIEHGYQLDRPVLKKMKKHGTWLVPTIVVSQPATAPFFEKIGSPQWYLDRRDSVGKEHWKALEIAIEEGVNIALGTDQLPAEPNDGTTATAREAQYYVEAGMTPLQALRAATIEPARMLGAEDEIGSLEVGKYADIVAVDKNPGEDITALRNILFVMKGGHVYRNKIER